MTLPNDDWKTVAETLKSFKKDHPDLRIIDLALDIGVSISTISMVLNYAPRYRPGRYVEGKIRDFVKKLKQKYPEERPAGIK